jgi:uncharacterized protein
MILPEPWWVFDLIALKDMPVHIYRHSLMVRKVAVTLAVGVARKTPIDIDLVDRAAMLHDICKADAIRNGGDHAYMGQRLLEVLGFPAVGAVIGQHVRLRELQLSEALLVNYADKRVMHERVVSLAKRFVDLLERYGKGDERRARILAQFDYTRKVEELITEAAGLEPLWLSTLNLPLVDDALYRGQGVRGQDGTIEEQDQYIDPERIHQH